MDNMRGLTPEENERKANMYRRMSRPVYTRFSLELGLTCDPLGSTLFKGKRIDSDEWVRGYLWNGADSAFIIPCNVGVDYNKHSHVLTAPAYEVIRETLRQSTHFVDSECTNIYEHDTIQLSDGCLGTVIYGTMVDSKLKYPTTGWFWKGVNEDGSDRILAMNEFWSGHRVIKDVTKLLKDTIKDLKEDKQ